MSESVSPVATPADSNLATFVPCFDGRCRYSRYETKDAIDET